MMNVTSLNLNPEFLRAAFQSAPVAMLLLDGFGCIITANDKFHREFGHAPDTLSSQGIEQIVPMDRFAFDSDNRARVLQIFASKMTHPSESASVRRADGSLAPVRIQMGQLQTPEGTANVCTFFDLSDYVTERNKTLRKIKQLEARNDALSRFAYGTSHDLKAPLASITGLLEFSIEDLNDGALDEVREQIETSLKLCKDSATRIDAVFEVGRVGEILYPAEEINLGNLIREIWHERSDGQDGRLELLLDANETNPIRSERPALRLIIDNLISNCIRFRDTDKSVLLVKVQIRVSANAVNITIADNGTGIPTDRHSDVFKMFRHIESRSGNGLGLSLIKRHIERLDGTITFRSIPGEGTEFSVQIPLDQDEDG